MLTYPISIKVKIKNIICVVYNLKSGKIVNRTNHKYSNSSRNNVIAN